MSVGVITSEIFLKHDTGTHPENLERLKSIHSFLENKPAWQKVEKIVPSKINFEALYKLHPPEYVKEVKDFCEKGGGRIDENTVTCKDSFEVALYSAGSAVNAVDLVLGKDFKKVFCFCRPPGHHALKDKYMGFCLFSNLSLGINHAIEKYGLNRVMVLDWDAHHGNGTEEIFYENEKVFTVSWHQHPFFPHTGTFDRIGEGKGKGFNLNIPLKEGATDQMFFETFENIVEPVIREYKPELIFLAGGYDAYYEDLFAGLNVTEKGFNYLSKKLVSLTEEICDGKLIVTLEGGYNLDGVAKGVFSTLDYMVHPEKKLFDKIEKDNSENITYTKNLIDEILNYRNSNL